MNKRLLKDKLQNDSVLSEQSELPPRKPLRPGSATQRKNQSQLDPATSTLKTTAPGKQPFKIKNRPGSAVRFDETAKARPERRQEQVPDEDEGPAADPSKSLVLKTKTTVAEIDYKVAVIAVESQSHLQFTLYNKKLKLAHSLSLPFARYHQFMQRIDEVAHKTTLQRLLKEIRPDPSSEGVRWSKKLQTADE